MTAFRFLDIDRKTNKALGEAPDDIFNMLSEKKYEEIKSQLENEQGCRITGQHEMYQVPSKLFFATDRDIWLINKLKKDAPDTYNKFSLEHYFE